MGREMRGKLVESLVDETVVSDRGLAVVGEKTVDVGADDTAVGRHGAFAKATCEFGEGPRAVGTFGHAHMHLVAGEGRSIGRLAFELFEPLITGKYRLDLEKAQTLRAVF